MANGSEAQTLGVIEGKLDMLIASASESRSDQKQLAAKAVELATQMQFAESHERRIQDLERTKAYLTGWVAAAGLIGGIGGWAIGLITHK